MDTHPTRTPWEQRSAAARLILFVVGILLALATAGTSREAGASDERLLAAGDGERLWVAKMGKDSGTFVLLHREVDQAEPGISPIMSATKGHLLSGGLSASNRQLWLAYTPVNKGEPITVRSVRIPTTSATDTLIKPAWSIQPSLPRGAELRSWAAASDSLWAVVRASDMPFTLAGGASRAGATAPAAVAAAVQTQPTTNDPATPDRQAGVPTDMGLSPATQAGSSPAAGKRDYLLRLNRRAWAQLPLPADWPHDAHVWVVMRRPTDRYPHLLSMYGSEQGADLWVHHNEDGRWVRDVYALQPSEPVGGVGSPASTGSASAAVVPLAIDGQIVVGTVYRQPGQVAADVSVLHQGKAISLGQTRVTGDALGAWAVVPFGKTVALLADDGRGVMSWSRMDLQGHHVEASVELPQSITIPLADAANWIVHTAVLVLATILMFASWRRDPSWHRLNLPEGVTLAQISQRLLAGAVDLAPCVLAAILIYDLEPLALFNNHWPGRSSDWEEMVPGAIAIGLFILHTTIGELLFSQTVGKRMFGLRVAGLEGERPAPWQIVLRCATKSFDLIAQLLLILPLVGPYRQRLGDLIARTVVLTPEPQTPKDEPKS